MALPWTRAVRRTTFGKYTGRLSGVTLWYRPNRPTASSIIDQSAIWLPNKVLKVFYNSKATPRRTPWNAIIFIFIHGYTTTLRHWRAMIAERYRDPLRSCWYKIPLTFHACTTDLSYWHGTCRVPCERKLIYMVVRYRFCKHIYTIAKRFWYPSSGWGTCVPNCVTRNIGGLIDASRNACVGH